MRIAICDDETIFAEKLKNNLQKEFAKHGTKCFFTIVNSGDMLLSICQREKIDAVFLDIAMPEIDGLETAKRLREIRKDIMIVFVSSKESTVFSAYEYSPIWFIPKSQMQLLERAVEKIVNKMKTLEKEASFTQIKIENKIVEIDIRDIKYFKSDGHYINYVDRNGNKSCSFRCRMREIELQLNTVWFVKTHNRFLVNLRSVRSIEGNELILFDGEHIPISRSQTNEVKEKFQDYLRSIR